jgi:hypothetical protein
MNATEIKEIERYAKSARKKRNASITDEAFDYWHDIVMKYKSLLKTGEKNER